MFDWLLGRAKGDGAPQERAGSAHPSVDPVLLRSLYAHLDPSIFQPPTELLPITDIAHMGRHLFDDSKCSHEEIEALDACFNLLESGDLLMDNGRFLEAAAAFDQCLRMIPTAQIPASRKAYALGMAGQIEESIATFGEALRRDRTDNESWYLLAEVCALGDHVLGLHAISQSFAHRGTNIDRHAADSDWAGDANKKPPYTFGRALRYLEFPLHCPECTFLLSPYPDAPFCRHCYCFRDSHEEIPEFKSRQERIVNAVKKNRSAAVELARLLVAYPSRVSPGEMPDAGPFLKLR